MLIDIGLNLAHAALDSDRPQVIDRAIAAGVGRMILDSSSGALLYRKRGRTKAYLDWNLHVGITG